MAKKRYVGFKYETPDDKEPVFDAKGIETVRRDGVPAQQKMTETCLKLVASLNIPTIPTIFFIESFFEHRISVK
jgi:DNA polymerase elongation subunit (family B)